MKRHITLLAAFALVAVISATTSAVAVTMIGSRQIRNGSIRPVDLNLSLQDSVPVAGVLSGNGLASLTGETRFSAVNGAGAALGGVSEDAAATLTPNNYISIDNFSAQVAVPLDSGESVDVRLVVDEDPTEFGCTIVAPEEKCETTQTISIREQRTFSMQLVGSGAEDDGGTHNIVVTWGGRILDQE